ncbi:glutathione S-transferase N-terminal domain-containing protein [Aliidiomarina sp. Khilg15.8]
MKLFGSYTSPYVRHCRIALLQTETKFEFLETDYTQSAKGSPAQRVPYLQHEGMQLHDSASILKYIRFRAEQPFCASCESFDYFCLVNAALDSTVNLFLLENSGVDIHTNNYTQRQASRIESVLQALEERAAEGLEWDDAGIRLACFIDWASFRKRLNFDKYPALLQWLDDANQDRIFTSTKPPAG